jgi:hypothetical protein
MNAAAADGDTWFGASVEEASALRWSLPNPMSKIVAEKSNSMLELKLELTRFGGHL